MKILDPIKSLKEALFARLYFAQAISLLGDAFTWIGIALLAFEFGGEESAKILAVALTLRVTAFIIFGSYAGVLADRFNRKKILLITNFCRLIVVFSLAFITNVWQLYVLIFVLNIFNAFFTPAYKACIPQLIAEKENYGNAIVLSNATWQLLGVLGPGLAGIVAVFWGSRDIFFVDSFTFLISSIFVLTIPANKLRKEDVELQTKAGNIWSDIINGTKLLFADKTIRFSVLIELVAAIAGAQILVNSVGLIKGHFLLSDKEYGWAMTAFGIGATIAAFSVNLVDKSKSKKLILILGALMVSIAVSLANLASFNQLLILWVIAGLGQSYCEMPSQILIAENIPLDKQGKAYGSHFAWSHLWWAIGYPIAGFTGIYFQDQGFLIGGLLSFALLLLVIFQQFFKTKSS